VRLVKLAAGRCPRCGHEPEVLEEMHFHHRDPRRKVANVADLVSRGASISKIMAEIAKCDLVCANCHAVLSSHQRSLFSPKVSEDEMGWNSGMSPSASGTMRLTITS